MLRVMSSLVAFLAVMNVGAYGDFLLGQNVQCKRQCKQFYHYSSPDGNKLLTWMMTDKTDLGSFKNCITAKNQQQQVDPKGFFVYVTDPEGGQCVEELDKDNKVVKLKRVRCTSFKCTYNCNQLYPGELEKCGKLEGCAYINIRDDKKMCKKDEK